MPVESFLPFRVSISLFSLLLSDDYMDEVMSYFSKMDLNGRLRKGELTLQEYREHSSY